MLVCRHGRAICYLCELYGTDDPRQIAIKKKLLQSNPQADDVGSIVITRKHEEESTQLVTPTISIRLVWKMLHRYPWIVVEWDALEAKRWYSEWKKLVPEYCRRCGSHWLRMEKKRPPDFTSRESFFEWTVARHNDVNDRLRKRAGGHPKFSMEEAYDRYKPERGLLSASGGV